MIESSKQFPETDLDAALRICQAHAAELVEKERKRKHDLALWQAGAEQAEDPSDPYRFAASSFFWFPRRPKLD